MSSPEISKERTPEEIYDDVFNSQPSFPYGSYDISELEARARLLEPTEPGYSHVRTPQWLAEIRDTYDRIGNIPILGVDIGSSCPILTESRRGFEFERDARRGQGLAAEAFDNESFSLLRGDYGYLRQLHIAVSKDQAAKDLLEVALKECLFHITPAEAVVGSESKARFRERLVRKIAEVDYGYVNDEQAQNIESGWRLRIDKEAKDTTYFDRIAGLMVPSTRAIEASLKLAKMGGKRAARLPGMQEIFAQAAERVPAGEGVATEYILWQTEYLTDKIVGNKRYRPARHVSLDAADPLEIALSSIRNMPEDVQDLHLFSRAIGSLFDPNRHIRHNLFEPLPFPSNSIAFITCIDAWPLHIQRDDTLHDSEEDLGAVTLRVLLDWYDKLAFGGKIVIFPWRIKRENPADQAADNQILEATLLEFSRQVEHAVHVAKLHKDVVSGWMSDADREIVKTMSPVVDERYDDLPALIIEKPTKASMRSRENAAKKLAKSLSRVPDLLDPTP